MANINQMIADLDQQISSLQTARDALASAHGVGPALTPGPRGFTAKKVAVVRTKRTMSPEAREKIAAAQRLRWARTPSGKKAAPKKVAPKKAQAKKVAAPAKKASAPRRPKASKASTPAAAVTAPAVETAAASEVVS